MVVVAIAGAVLAIFGGAAPTGIRAVDVIYVGVGGAALTLAGGRARRYTWLLTGVAGLWLAPTTPARLAALAAVGLALYAVRSGRRRSLGAAVGAIMAFVLGDLGAGPFLGATSLFAVAAAAPMLLSGLVHMPEGARHSLVRCAGGIAAAAGLASAVFAGAVALSAEDVMDAADATERGLDLASGGDQTGAAGSFAAASAAFEGARGRVSGFWMLPARLVPIVGQHARAVQVVTAEGTALTQTATEAAESVDPDDVRLTDGRIDLGLPDTLQPVLTRVERALDRASTRVSAASNPWIVAPVQDRLTELVTELDSARPAAHTAASAARELPAMLGAGGPTCWLVLLTTPAEARGLGGLVGNWTLIEADGGQLRITAAGRNEDLNTLLRARSVELSAPSQYDARWARFSPNEFFQDVTLSPDLPMVAEVAANLFTAATDTRVDGVVVLDPTAMAGILELSGPAQAGDRQITTSTVVPFLLEGQYVEFAEDEEQRVQVLGELVANTFQAFTTGQLPGPRAVADTLGPLADQDRIGMWWRQGGGPQELILDAGLDGAFPEAGPGDLLALVHQNAGQNKLDSYLSREVDYRLQVTEGAAAGRISITLRNKVEDLTLPLAIIGNNDQGFPLGTNVVRLGIHTALPVQQALLDGTEVAIEREVAFGHEVVTARIEIPPGESRVLELDVAGMLPVSAESYRLTLPNQPLVHPDLIELHVDVDGSPVELPTQFELHTDEVLGAEAG